MNFPRISSTSRRWEPPSAISHGVSCLSSEVAVGSTLKRQESWKIGHFNRMPNRQTRILAKSEQSPTRSCRSHPAAKFLYQAHFWCWPGWKICLSFKMFRVLPNPLAGSEATLQTLSLLFHLFSNSKIPIVQISRRWESQPWTLAWSPKPRCIRCAQHIQLHFLLNAHHGKLWHWGRPWNKKNQYFKETFGTISWGNHTTPFLREGEESHACFPWWPAPPRVHRVHRAHSLHVWCSPKHQKGKV